MGRSLGIQIACFDVCQNIGMEIKECGERITVDAVHFPATHAQITTNLQALKRFADRALAVLDAAHVEWRLAHDLSQPDLPPIET